MAKTLQCNDADPICWGWRHWAAGEDQMSAAKPSNNDGTMTFRCPSDLQAAFVAACKAQDVTAAQVLRAAMRDFLEKAEKGGKE